MKILSGLWSVRNNRKRDQVNNGPLARRARKGVLGIGLSVGHFGEKEPELDFILVFFICLGYNRLI